MICPKCGGYNRDSNPHCTKCGADLTGVETGRSWQEKFGKPQAQKAYIRVDDEGGYENKPDSRDALADEMVELKKRKEEGMKVQRMLRENSARRGAAPSGMNVETRGPKEPLWQSVENDEREPVPEPIAYQRKDVRRGGSRTSVSREEEAPVRRGETRWEDTYSEESLWSGQASFDSHYGIPRVGRGKPVQSYGRLPSRGRGLRRLIYVVLALFVAALIGLCIFFGVNWYLAVREETKVESQAIITASMINEIASHTIRIPGEDGQQIYIRELHTTYIVTDGYATIELEDHTWYDNLEDFVEETIPVTLTPFVKSTTGRQQPLEPITYEIMVPESPIKLLTPDNHRQEVVTAMYTMSFQVRPGSTVYVNDRNVSDTVDELDGTFSYNATVQPIGDNVFTIRVRSEYCRESQMVVTLYREPQEIPLDLAAETYTSTTVKQLQINATTLPGATIEVSSHHSDLNITNLDTTGEFSFYAIFDKIGNNTITISASYPGKKTSVVNYVMYYIPTDHEYTRAAWPLNEAGYSELVSNITYRAEHTQVYVVMGELAYIVSEKPQMGVFYTSPDGKSQPVLVENCTTTEWKVGTYYRIYADAYGTYNSMPWLCGRYVYLK